MDIDTEEDVTPRPRKHRAKVFDRLNQLENINDSDDEDDEPYQTPLVLKKRYQAKIVEDDDEECSEDGEENEGDEEDEEERPGDKQKAIAIGNRDSVDHMYVLIIIC